MMGLGGAGGHTEVHEMLFSLFILLSFPHN